MLHIGSVLTSKKGNRASEYSHCVATCSVTQETFPDQQVHPERQEIYDWEQHPLLVRN